MYITLQGLRNILRHTVTVTIAMLSSCHVIAYIEIFVNFISAYRETKLMLLFTVSNMKYNQSTFRWY